MTLVTPRSMIAGSLGMEAAFGIYTNLSGQGESSRYTYLLWCVYRFRNHRLLFASTIDSLETPVIMLSYGGLGHGHDGGLDVADAGCTGRNVLSVSVVLWLMCVQRTLRSVCGVFRSPDPIYSNRAVLAQLV